MDPPLRDSTEKAAGRLNSIFLFQRPSRKEGTRALDISGPASIPVSGKKFIPPVGRNAERKALDMDVRAVELDEEKNK